MGDGERKGVGLRGVGRAKPTVGLVSEVATATTGKEEGRGKVLVVGPVGGGREGPGGRSVGSSNTGWKDSLLGFGRGMGKGKGRVV